MPLTGSHARSFLGPLGRRQFLRSGSAVLALPFLEALALRAARGKDPMAPRRMVCIMTNTGLLADNFFPAQTGKDFEPSRYLAHLEGIARALLAI